MADYDTAAFKRYAAVHETPQGAGDARPTAVQIVKDEHLEGALFLPQPAKRTS